MKRMLQSRRRGPVLRASDPWLPEDVLLSEDESAELSGIASIVQFRDREAIFNEGEFSILIES